MRISSYFFGTPQRALRARESSAICFAQELLGYYPLPGKFISVVVQGLI